MKDNEKNRLRLYKAVCLVYKELNMRGDIAIYFPIEKSLTGLESRDWFTETENGQISRKSTEEIQGCVTANVSIFIGKVVKIRGKIVEGYCRQSSFESSYCIHVCYEHPLEMVVNILAHELRHAWQTESGCADYDGDVEWESRAHEGDACVFADKFVQKHITQINQVDDIKSVDDLFEEGYVSEHNEDESEIYDLL